MDLLQNPTSQFDIRGVGVRERKQRHRMFLVIRLLYGMCALQRECRAQTLMMRVV
jgi:hypothetical protein